MVVSFQYHNMPHLFLSQTYKVPTSTFDNHQLFSAAIEVVDGSNMKASFGLSSWLYGSALRYIAPKIFEAYKHKKFSVCDALNHATLITSKSTILSNSFTIDGCYH
jgi:hypothetical protein